MKKDGLVMKHLSVAVLLLIRTLKFVNEVKNWKNKDRLTVDPVLQLQLHFEI